MITAPFNFVPLSEKVFFPDWAEKVSHDVPFEDAQSGVIDITITAKSPIFVRDHENPEQFCSHDGTCYIPGSSVKGMVRNVLEIMSFSKMKIDSEKHAVTTSVRDMSDSKNLVGSAKGCGFLKKDENGKWIIVDYGEPRTINYSNQTNKTISNGSEIIHCDFETAEEKYNENGMYQQIGVIGETQDLLDRNNHKIGIKKIAQISTNGEKAYLILTGGISGKKNEFVFMESDRIDKVISDIDKVVEKFKKVYFESESVDGRFWKGNWKEGIGIPIFYIKDRNNNITDIGLSQLFKLAYPHTISDITRQTIEMMDVPINDEKVEKDEKLDLSETIFGAIRKYAPSLKGRVQFSHFKADANPQSYGSVTTVLGSPRTSFYPEYIKQNCNQEGKVLNNKYMTLMDGNAQISGWKRYPLRYGKPNVKLCDKSDSSSTFTPIGSYNGNSFNEFTFNGKVRFYNLKSVELGALLSALTFHNNQNNFYHNIGMAKSLGFGKIEISVNTDPYAEYLQEYEVVMTEWAEKKLNKKWIETEHIMELFTMHFKGLNIDNKLKYLVLDPERKINEFVDKKNIKVNREEKGRECLPKVSEMFDMGDNYPKTLLTEEVLQQAKVVKEKKEAQEEFKIKLNEVMGTENTQIIQNFIDKYSDYTNIDEIKSKKEQIENSKKADKYKEVNQKVDTAWELVQKKKGNHKLYQKELDKFIKKWSADKNNKGSQYVIDLVDEAKK